MIGMDSYEEQQERKRVDDLNSMYGYDPLKEEEKKTNWMEMLAKLIQSQADKNKSKLQSTA
jgi:hypothetical protein